MSAQLAKIFLKKELIYFRQVYLSGSMSHAAIELNTTQSAVSKAILDLEARTKEALFIRSRHGVKATLLAEDFFKKTEEIIALVQPPMQNNKPLPIKLGFHPSIGIDFFPDTLFGALRTQKSVLSFKLQTSKRCVHDVLIGKLDLAIVANPVRHKDLVIRQISKQNILLFESEKTFEHQQTLVHPDQIGLIKSLKRLKLHATVELEDYEMIAFLVGKSRGAFNGVLPEHVAKRHGLKTASKTLHKVAICLVYRADNQNIKLLRNL